MKPTTTQLERYAAVLLAALNGHEGPAHGDVILLQVPECAKPLLRALQRAVLMAGCHPLVQFLPDEFSREFYELASDEQLDFFPAAYLRGRLETIDHSISIIAETNKHELEDIPPERLLRRQRAFKPYLAWRDEKETAGKYSWTLGLYGTEAMAREVGLSLDEYWDEIIAACYLDHDDPVGKWRAISAEIARVKHALDALRIERLHIEAPDTDLWVRLGPQRRWLGGSGRNVPSFEVFISPDWRGTTGHIQFTEPLFIYGHRVERVFLRFKDGVVVEARAAVGEDMLKALIATENADKIGEFSLTDARLSRITRFMGETLYDENVGGSDGNTHLALGKAYRESYPGDAAGLTDDDWAAMGYNDSVIHTDIVATSPRTVTAELPDGTTKIIYAHGNFLV